MRGWGAKEGDEKREREEGAGWGLPTPVVGDLAYWRTPQGRQRKNPLGFCDRNYSGNWGGSCPPPLCVAVRCCVGGHKSGLPAHPSCRIS